MSCLGNIVWMIFGGFVAAIGWCLSGLLLCVTIIGIPFGVQCFKMAGLQLAPFGKEVVYDNQMGCGSTVGNLIWILVCGWELALSNLISALLFAITIVGLPFAKQSLKLAQLSLFPFGCHIVNK